jgi:hypothetical protein
MLPSNMLLLNLSLPIDVTFSTPTPDFVNWASYCRVPVVKGENATGRLGSAALRVVQQDVEAPGCVPQDPEEQRDLTSMVDAVIGSVMHQFSQAQCMLWAATKCELYATIEIFVAQCR